MWSRRRQRNSRRCTVLQLEDTAGACRRCWRWGLPSTRGITQRRHPCTRPLRGEKTARSVCKSSSQKGRMSTRPTKRDRHPLTSPSPATTPASWMLSRSMEPRRGLDFRNWRGGGRGERGGGEENLRVRERKIHTELYICLLLVFN